MTVQASTNRWKPYPTYKHSGVEWLEKIPSHWEVKRVKHVSSIENSGAYGVEAGEAAVDLPVCTTAHVTPDGRFLVEDMPLRGFSISEASRYFGKPGDLFVVKSSGSNTNIISGKLALVTEDTQKIVFGNFLMRIRPSPRIIWSPFLAYLLSSQLTRERIQRMVATTTYPNIDVPEYVGSAVAIPPLGEQSAIAAFLDRETARIDALVAKKERVIELLREKRTALITHTVIKGLDPTVRMKDSGVEWLGKIPAHWDILVVKRRAKRIQTGTTPPTGEAHYYEDGTVPWFGPGSFADDLLLAEPVKFISDAAITKGGARVFESGSTLVVTIGATIGKVGYIARAASSNQQITAVTFDSKRMVPKYAAYQMKRLEPVLRGIAPSTTLPILDQDEIGCLPLTVPPVSEQDAIVAFLDRETAKIDALIAKVREGIEKLKEYRTALISAAVTGKIDVREEVAG